jgi:hypothetical protein
LDYSHPVSLGEVLKKGSSEITEVGHDPFYTSLRAAEDTNLPGVFQIFIEPLFVFTNCLPFEVELDLIEIQPGEEKDEEDDEIISNTVKLQTQQEYQEHKISVKKRLYISFSLPGFEKSERVLIHSGTDKTTLPDHLTLQEKRGLVLTSGQKSKIYFSYQKNNKAFLSVYFYAKGCIINQTHQDLTYFHIKDDKKKITNFAGQIPLNIMIALTNRPGYLSNEVSIQTLGDSTIEIKYQVEDENRFEMMEFGMNIDLIKSGKGKLL